MESDHYSSDGPEEPQEQTATFSTDPLQTQPWNDLENLESQQTAPNSPQAIQITGAAQETPQEEKKDENGSMKRKRSKEEDDDVKPPPAKKQNVEKEPTTVLEFMHAIVKELWDVVSKEPEFSSNKQVKAQMEMILKDAGQICVMCRLYEARYIQDPQGTVNMLLLSIGIDPSLVRPNVLERIQECAAALIECASDNPEKFQ